jgi:DNA-binding Lrp family transcriptional regulator
MAEIILDNIDSYTLRKLMADATLSQRSSAEAASRSTKDAAARNRFLQRLGIQFSINIADYEVRVVDQNTLKLVEKV